MERVNHDKRKKGLKTSPFDPAKYIGDPKAMQEYLNVTFEEDGDNLKEIGSSLDVIARAWLLIELEHKTKLDRSDLNQILLGAGNPTPEALTKIAEALGLEMPAHFGKTLPLHPQTPKPQTQGRSPKHYPPPSPNKITPHARWLIHFFLYKRIVLPLNLWSYRGSFCGSTQTYRRTCSCLKNNFIILNYSKKPKTRPSFKTPKRES
ncbi:MAG: hypothetical protein J6P29_02465 [Acetobacter sp.]|nr:hypothetical protein [Acetobacter sp.]